MPESLSLEDAVENYICMRTVGATVSELEEPYRDMVDAFKERQQTMDLERIFLDQLYEAANESNWIPEWYYMNDWISDATHFLRTGEGIYEE